MKIPVPDPDTKKLLNDRKMAKLKFKEYFLQYVYTVYKYLTF